MAVLGRRLQGRRAAVRSCRLAVIEVAHDGARGRGPETYLRDIAVLEASLRAQPDNTRNVFYLAQSYRDAGLLQDSRSTYARRAAMGGWDEETWYAQFQVAALTERLQAPPAEVRDAYLAAYALRPSRAEPSRAELCE